jgi:mono/diheme cytochrome c family protein
MNIQKCLFVALMSGMASALRLQCGTAGQARRSTENEVAPSSAPFDLGDPARIKSGRALFQSTCADYCHGHQPALFVDREGLEMQYVFNTIRDGGKGATPMPPWGEVFSQDEIWELVAYIKSLGKW